MIAELYLKARTKEQEERLKRLIDLNFIDLLKDFLEDEIDFDWACKNCNVIPTISYIGADNKVIKEVTKSNKPQRLAMKIKRTYEGKPN